MPDSAIVFTIGCNVLLADFLDLSIGKSLDSIFFSFLERDPKPVIPNLPRIYDECYLKGIASQLPLAEAVDTNLLILSMSLSQEMHLSCFFVKSASFSFY